MSKIHDFGHWRLGFGKYKGHALTDIPTNYIRWGAINFTSRTTEQTMFAAELAKRTQPKERTRPKVDKHLDHEMEIIEGPFQQHAAKLICKQCNTWVMWLPKNYEELLNEKENRSPIV
jgi:hypothetical protein